MHSLESGWRGAKKTHLLCHISVQFHKVVGLSQVQREPAETYEVETTLASESEVEIVNVGDKAKTLLTAVVSAGEKQARYV